MQQKHLAAAAVILILFVVIAFAAHRHSKWMKQNCVCTVDGFHGWRSQHYTDNPYNGQNYQCGRGHADPSRDRFAVDGGH